MSGIRFRDGTQDAEVWRQVFAENEYRVAPSLAGAVVVDVGLHVGSFAALCKARGAAEVTGVEPCRESLELAAANFGATPGRGRLTAVHAACWRSDVKGARVGLHLAHPAHTGNHRTLPDGGSDVPTVALDDILAGIARRGKRCDLLKVDCEGAEWPILMTSRMLHLVDAIAGEYHAGVIPDLPAAARVPGLEYSTGTLAAYLARGGFAVDVLPPNAQCYNLFFARRGGR